MTDRRWFAVRCKPNSEFSAWHELERQGFSVYLPREMKLIRHARKMKEVSRPFFPGYLFLHLASSERRWTAIRSTPGVVCAVHFGINYPFVPDVAIAVMKSLENTSGFVCQGKDPVSPFKLGEGIMVRDGQFSNIAGVFVSRSGEERAMVLLEMLQRQVKVSLPLAILKAA